MAPTVPLQVVSGAFIGRQLDADFWLSRAELGVGEFPRRARRRQDVGHGHLNVRSKPLRILRMIASTIIYNLFQSILSRFFRFGGSRILLLPNEIDYEKIDGS